MARLDVRVGKTVLKNPLIAGSAEHLIDADGVRRALRAGVGAVVVKSINETERGRDQLQRAEYMLFDDEWREMPWSADAPATAFMATRSGLTPQTFEAWLEQTLQLDREAKAMDAYAIASVIVADLATAIGMAKQVEQAGVRMLELNIGTPYASQARGVVSTELEPERVTAIVSAVRKEIRIPLWVKITGQSERVPDLAAAAFGAGAEAVVMAGRLLGIHPGCRDAAALSGHHVRCRRHLESAAHLSLACSVAAESRSGPGHHRNQRCAHRARCRTHDARGRERG